MTQKIKKLIPVAIVIILAIGLVIYFLSISNNVETPTEKKNTEIEQRPSGEIPIDYPIITNTNATAGQYILAPAIEDIEKAYKRGLYKISFDFFKGKMIEPGENESLIEDFLGDENYIPNSLIIPIEPNGSIKEGDIVMTWWEDGSKVMIKGIITDASNPETPSIKYLADFNDEEIQLEENTFQKLTNKLTPGITIVKETEEGHEFGIVVHIAEDKALILSNQTLIVENIDEIEVVPQKSNIKVGDSVIVPFISNQKDVKVIEVDTERGKITIEYEWAGEILSDTFYFGEIKKL